MSTSLKEHAASRSMAIRGTEPSNWRIFPAMGPSIARSSTLRARKQSCLMRPRLFKALWPAASVLPDLTCGKNPPTTNFGVLFFQMDGVVAPQLSIDVESISDADSDGVPD